MHACYNYMCSYSIGKQSGWSLCAVGSSPLVAVLRSFSFRLSLVRRARGLVGRVQPHRAL